MTEGGISAWKKAEGEAFSSLEIVCAFLLHSSRGLTMHPHRKPTKAVIDLEAQEDGAHISEFAHPRHRPRKARRMLLSVLLRFSKRKKITFLMLQSWPPILPRKLLLPRRKRPPRLSRLQNRRRRFLELRRSPSSRKRPHLHVSDSQKKSLWPELPCRKSKVLVLMVVPFTKTSRSITQNRLQLAHL